MLMSAAVLPTLLFSFGHCFPLLATIW